MTSTPQVVYITVDAVSGTQTTTSLSGPSAPKEEPGVDADAEDASSFYASLFAPDELRRPSSSDEHAGTLCAECGARYTCTAAEHQSSIAHATVVGSGATHHFVVPPTNRGYQMLERLGWDEESGLGRGEDGVVEPVTAVLRVDRAGIGAGRCLSVASQNFSAKLEKVRKEQRRERTVGKAKLAAQRRRLKELLARKGDAVSELIREQVPEFLQQSTSAAPLTKVAGSERQLTEYEREYAKKRADDVRALFRL